MRLAKGHMDVGHCFALEGRGQKQIHMALHALRLNHVAASAGVHGDFCVKGVREGAYAFFGKKSGEVFERAP